MDSRRQGRLTYMDNRHFDEWATDYEKSVKKGKKSYPFEGYEIILSTMQKAVSNPEGLEILDVGVGTGALSFPLYAKGAYVSGLDFSGGMLKVALEKMPNARFYHFDIKKGWPEALEKKKFDYILSSYAFHHLDDERKIEIIKIYRDHLTLEGNILIGDVAFENRNEMELCKKKYKKEWDDKETYMIGDDMIASLYKENIRASYRQISFCAGILRIFG